MLFDQIVRAKQGNQEDMENLVVQFMPLLRKYSRKLFWEDALNDMTLAFLEIIHGMKTDVLKSRGDGTIVTYLAQSVRNAYIKLLERYFRQPDTVLSLNEATERDKLEFLSAQAADEYQSFFSILEGCPDLTEKEKTVLALVYYWGYTAAEIARGLSESKQNINQIKLRGLRKLRQQVSNGSDRC